jgi:uncharacterized protein YndB with AHSA1/START domain
VGVPTIAEVDLRVGGTWRYVMMANGGFEVAFHGEYREIVPNERIVSTEIYEGMPEGEAVDTATFSEKAGRTTLTILVQHQSKEHRDGYINSGMEGGMQEGPPRAGRGLAPLSRISGCGAPGLRGSGRGLQDEDEDDAVG